MFALAALAIYVVSLLAAGLSDLVRFEIPNRLCLALVAAFALLAPTLPLLVTGWHLAAGVTMLAATAAGFAFGILGGGDAKLLAAAALWMGWGNLAPFILVTAIAGAILGLALLVIRRLVPQPPPSGRWFSRLLAKGEGVPYGLAIAVSGLILVPRLGSDLLR